MSKSSRKERSCKSAEADPRKEKKGVLGKEKKRYFTVFCELGLGAGSAFPSVVALIPLGENADTRSILQKVIDNCSDCDIHYSSLGNVRKMLFI